MLEDERPPAEPTVRVWKENWDSVQVFVRCSWNRVVAGDRLVSTGIATTEIEAVARLLGIPRRRLPQVLDDVRQMVGVALPELTR